MAKNIITGIDAGTSTIKVIVSEQKKNGQIEVLGTGKKISHGIRKGYVANYEDAAEAIKSAIKSAEKMAGVQIKHAYITVGGIILGSVRSKGSVMISRADGEVTDYDVKRVISQAEENLKNISNKRVIKSFPINFKIDGNLAFGKPVGMKGTKLEAEVLFITCLNQHLMDLIRAVESAGVAVDDVVASPLAASFVALNKHQKEVGCVLANIGAGTVSIMVFEEGKPISLEVFPIGSTHITNDIALGLQITLEEAEKIKIGYGSKSNYSKRKLSDIIEARLKDIFELIESHLKKINRNGLLPAGIILTGGGSSLLTLDEIAKASLRLPATVGSPAQIKDKIVLKKQVREDLFNNPEWSVALGLCAMKFKEEKTEGAYGIKLQGKFILQIAKSLKKWFSQFLP